ncbi:unnamed protein product, partial [Tetraodon nigroviridis]
TSIWRIFLIPPKVLLKLCPKLPQARRLRSNPNPNRTMIADLLTPAAADDFDLADALDPSNDIGVKDKNKGGRNPLHRIRGFSDSDLEDVSKDNTYKPDKGKGEHPRGDNDRINQYDDNNETTAEVGTLAGIVSAVAVALVGAISSYISYQKKKLCFSIQQSLNAEMVKAENPDAVVATEPQGKN